MKRCPRCNHIDDDAKEFCEDDGTPLVSEQLSSPSAGQFAPQPNTVARRTTASQDALLTGAVGLVAGLAIAAVAFAMFDALMPGSAEPETPSEQTAKLTIDTSNQPTKAALQPSGENKKAINQALNASPSPALSPTPSPEPALTPSPTPSPVSQTGATLDGAGPAMISTNSRKDDVNRDLVIIRFTDGKSMEVDDAWEDGQGVWYRRGSFVALIERGRVEAVKRRPVLESSAIPQPTP